MYDDLDNTKVDMDIINHHSKLLAQPMPLYPTPYD